MQRSFEAQKSRQEQHCFHNAAPDKTALAAADGRNDYFCVRTRTIRRADRSSVTLSGS